MSAGPLPIPSDFAPALTDYLSLHLPLTSAMEVSVRSATEKRVELDVPLVPNLNHEQTAFGGSISACGILAGWGLLWVMTQQRDPQPRLVIANSSTKYIRPIAANFEVVCDAPAETLLRQFDDNLAALGKAKLNLRSELYCEGKIAAVHDGVYVAMRPEGEATS